MFIVWVNEPVSFALLHVRMIGVSTPTMRIGDNCTVVFLKLQTAEKVKYIFEVWQSLFGAVYIEWSAIHTYPQVWFYFEKEKPSLTEEHFVIGYYVYIITFIMIC